MAKERTNGDRTVGPSHREIELLAMGEGPVGRAAKEEALTAAAPTDIAMEEDPAVLREIYEDWSYDPSSNL